MSASISYTLPELLQCRRPFGMGHVVNNGPAHYHQIDGRQVVLGRAETFSYQAFYTIPGHGSFGAFFGDRKPEPGMRTWAAPRQNRKRTVATANGLLENAAELASVGEARLTGKTLPLFDVRSYRLIRLLKRLRLVHLTPMHLTPGASNPGVSIPGERF